MTKLSYKLYKCKECGHTTSMQTNHFGNTWSAGKMNTCEKCPPHKKYPEYDGQTIWECVYKPNTPIIYDTGFGYDIGFFVDISPTYDQVIVNLITGVAQGELHTSHNNIILYNTENIDIMYKKYQYKHDMGILK